MHMVDEVTFPLKNRNVTLPFWRIQLQRQCNMLEHSHPDLTIFSALVCCNFCCKSVLHLNILSRQLLKYSNVPGCNTAIEFQIISLKVDYPLELFKKQSPLKRALQQFSQVGRQDNFQKSSRKLVLFGCLYQIVLETFFCSNYFCWHFD